MKDNAITVKSTVQAPLEKVWGYWTDPKHIINWNFASDQWHAPKAENDLRKGGRFSYRMESKDGNTGFDMEGAYQEVQDHKRIRYTLDDGREVAILFHPSGNATLIEEQFEPENTFSRDMQQEGWQAILDNFKKYVEQDS